MRASATTSGSLLVLTRYAEDHFVIGIPCRMHLAGLRKVDTERYEGISLPLGTSQAGPNLSALHNEPGANAEVPELCREARLTYEPGNVSCAQRGPTRSIGELKSTPGGRTQS